MQLFIICVHVSVCPSEHTIKSRKCKVGQFWMVFEKNWGSRLIINRFRKFLRIFSKIHFPSDRGSKPSKPITPEKPDNMLPAIEESKASPLKSLPNKLPIDNKPVPSDDKPVPETSLENLDKLDPTDLDNLDPTDVLKTLPPSVLNGLGFKPDLSDNPSPNRVLMASFGNDPTRPTHSDEPKKPPNPRTTTTTTTIIIEETTEQKWKRLLSMRTPKEDLSSVTEDNESVKSLLVNLIPATPTVKSAASPHSSESSEPPPRPAPPNESSIASRVSARKTAVIDPPKAATMAAFSIADKISKSIQVTKSAAVILAPQDDDSATLNDLISELDSCVAPTLPKSNSLAEVETEGQVEEARPMYLGINSNSAGVTSMVTTHNSFSTEMDEEVQKIIGAHMARKGSHASPLLNDPAKNPSKIIHIRSSYDKTKVRGFLVPLDFIEKPGLKRKYIPKISVPLRCEHAVGGHGLTCTVHGMGEGLVCTCTNHGSPKSHVR